MGFDSYDLKTDSPTVSQYAVYQSAYSYFNEKLFNGKLPDCLLGFERRKNSMGFFKAHGWKHSSVEQNQHYIALNPDFLTRPHAEIFATLVHEMCHLQHFTKTGKPTSYHDRVWADLMLEVGLIPTDSGEEGGKQTGPKMTHYIEPYGRFEMAVNEMPEDIRFPWVSADPAPEQEKEEQSSKSKEKYFCPKCGAKVWGKPGLNLLCGCSGDLPVFEPNSLKERPNPNPLKTLANMAQLLTEQGKTDEEIIEGFKATPIIDYLNELNPLRPIIRKWLKTEPERPAVTIRRVMFSPEPAPEPEPAPAPEPETEAIANIEPAPEPAPKITERFMKQFLKKNHPEIFSDVGVGKKYPTALMAATAIGIIRKIKGKADFEFC